MNYPFGFTIRPETAADLELIRNVHRRAFGREEEARLVDELRDGGYAQISLVAEVDQVVGHILFSDIQIVARDSIIPALALAPLAVLPDFQRQGIGSSLVRSGLEMAWERGDRIAIVLGDPNFYRRFGFYPELASRLESPYSGEGWMACELAPGALRGVQGVVRYPKPFESV